MNLTPSLITISVPDCNFFIFLEICYKIAKKKSFLHDLITRVFLRSLQYGIVVLGFFDAFVYAHDKHRFDSANAGNFGDCMTGRV